MKKLILMLLMFTSITELSKAQSKSGAPKPKIVQIAEKTAREKTENDTRIYKLTPDQKPKIAEINLQLEIEKTAAGEQSENKELLKSIALKRLQRFQGVLTPQQFQLFIKEHEKETKGLE